jgi:peptidoglycan biosynthesis protein MviN/MurJ (putative lipid II flippase)
LKQDILRHWALTAQIALNALVGYAFIKFLASNWGASAHKDAFDIAYSVPFLLMSVSGVTFLEAVITTRFSTIREGHREQANAMFSSLLSYLLVFAACVLGLTSLFAAQLTELLAPGLQASAKREVQDLIVLFMPLVVVLGVGSLLSAILTAWQAPVGTELCQLISRSGFLCGWVLFDYTPSLNGTAISLSVFGACGLLLIWIMFRRITKFHYKPRLGDATGEIRSILNQGVGLLLTAILAQAALAYLRRLGSLDGVGTIAMLSYALALIYPLSILLAKPIASVIGPRYIRYMRSGGSPFGPIYSVVLLCGATFPDWFSLRNDLWPFTGGHRGYPRRRRIRRVCCKCNRQFIEIGHLGVTSRGRFKGLAGATP